jgi:hypothetical protein
MSDVTWACDVCGDVRPVKYCRACDAWICDDCRPNIFRRALAAIKRFYNVHIVRKDKQS